MWPIKPSPTLNALVCTVQAAVKPGNGRPQHGPSSPPRRCGSDHRHRRDRLYQRTHLRRVLKHASAEDGCWVAAFALRWVRYERIAEILARYGLATEQLSGHTFRQRRFADDTERDYVLGELENMGIDPAGKETEGWYHSNFYLSCPSHPISVPARAAIRMRGLTCHHAKTGNPLARLFAGARPVASGAGHQQFPNGRSAHLRRRLAPSSYERARLTIDSVFGLKSADGLDAA